MMNLTPLPTVRDVFRLWDSISDMSAALSLPALTLIRHREADELPPQAYDRHIVRQARWTGSTIRQRTLRQMRMSKAEQTARAAKSERGARMQELFEAAGGREAFARKLRVTQNQCGIWKTRGRIPPAYKWDVLQLAQTLEIEVKHDLFDAVPG
jgi:hypothetical protein